jgi:cell division control protein 24
MEMAHGPGLTRIYTAPSLSSSRTKTIDPFPARMNHGPRSSKMSGSSSTITSASSASLNTLTPATSIGTQNGGQVIATNNIINQRADASRSLYQICLTLRQRLQQVPGFEQYLNEADNRGGDTDPVESLWGCLREGVPLLAIYNAIQPEVPLKIDDKISEAKRPKHAAFMFVQACLQGLKLPPGECFVLSDLLGEDTTGFVKVGVPCSFPEKSDDGSL